LHKLHKLRQILGMMDSALVCFSAGVDSAFLLKIAADELGERVLALTAESPSLAPDELSEARALAGRIGVRHLIVPTAELDDPRYAANPTNRCYFCKSELLSVARRVAREQALAEILIGTNVDDLGDHRPGLQAANEAGARHPLVEAGLTKTEIRAFSRDLDLPTWDKPEMACLSSRFAYGSEITADRLDRVAQFEKSLKNLGFVGLRVRFHEAVARIELAPDQIARAVEPATRDRIIALGKDLGFTYVTLDLRGYRRGAMNEVGP
jgi:uncharacterized protein